MLGVKAYASGILNGLRYGAIRKWVASMVSAPRAGGIVSMEFRLQVQVELALLTASISGNMLIDVYMQLGLLDGHGRLDMCVDLNIFTG